MRRLGSRLGGGVGAGVGTAETSCSCLFLERGHRGVDSELGSVKTGDVFDLRCVLGRCTESRPLIGCGFNEGGDDEDAIFRLLVEGDESSL